MFNRMLQEDLMFGDITSEAIIPKNLEAEGSIVARENCILAGAEYVAKNLKNMGFEVWNREDSEEIKPGEEVMRIKGLARELLAVERTVLNILGRMSGVATETNRIVRRVKKINGDVRIACTRKTLWGYLDKMAVKIGGGDTHRWNLGDMILIKDNHIALVGLEEAIKKAREVSFTKKIEVEADNEQLALKAARLGADIIMLDNFAPEEVCKIAKELRKYGVIIEVSGGITSDNVEEYARCEVDVISMGCITHSAKSVDFSMEMIL